MDIQNNIFKIIRRGYVERKEKIRILRWRMDVVYTIYCVYCVNCHDNFYCRINIQWALWIPAFMALVVSFFFAKDKKAFSETIIGGMASKEAIIPIVCWIFAGVFSRILRESGLAGGIAGLSASIGMSGTLFIIVSFISSALLQLHQVRDLEQ